MNVYRYDPLLSDSVIAHFGTKQLSKLNKKMDTVIITVAHVQFRKMGGADILELMNNKPELVEDVKGMVDKNEAEKNGMYYRKL